MRNRIVYLTAALLAGVAAISLLAFAGKAVVAGKIQGGLAFGVVGLGVAWLCWEFARAQKDVRTRYSISGDQLLTEGFKEEQLSLSRVAVVVSDAHSGFISLRDTNGHELRRIHIDNPIVEELKVYCAKPKKG